MYTLDMCAIPNLFKVIYRFLKEICKLYYIHNFMKVEFLHDI